MESETAFRANERGFGANETGFRANETGFRANSEDLKYSVVNVDKRTSTRSCFSENCLRGIALTFLVISVSFSTTIFTFKYVSAGGLIDSSVDASVYEPPQYSEAERQIQKKPTFRPQVGAQMSINQTLLSKSPPKLMWSHQSSDDYLDGIQHVTHYYGNHSFDCLEIPSSGRYLVAIQVTYRFSISYPSTAVRTYFTLTRFRRDAAHLVAKSEYPVQAPRLRSSATVRKSVTMVRSIALNIGDRMSVTVSHPALIYASKIDNFFGIIQLR